MKYDVILFDADETLFDFKKSEREAFKNAMLEFGIDYDESYHLQIYQEINTAIWKEFEEGLITQAKLKIERFERLATRLGVTFDAQAFSTSYMKHLADASFLYEGASLKQKRWRTDPFAHRTYRTRGYHQRAYGWRR